MQYSQTWLRSQGTAHLIPLKEVSHLPNYSQYFPIFLNYPDSKRVCLTYRGGSQSVASYEDLSSSSFSSASRASLDARSSPTPSYGAENMMVFPGDSSGSI
ncbi:hypothetical protein EAG_15383 [Camponotus floridanus]|uniref:Uncharacterized protein n=1 Tax=Camponotus floridanus TaxID=104421 RepID=E2AKF1_CAMFO|nr:hypothetical protein EAG_15383 [Camponotus floridanus]